jgi:hypothetical protein
LKAHEGRCYNSGMSTPRKKPLTNICHCGHAWDEHHNSGIQDGWAEECLHFHGKSESGGLDAHGLNHCQRYINTSLPDDLPRRLRGGPPPPPADFYGLLTDGVSREPSALPPPSKATKPASLRGMKSPKPHHKSPSVKPLTAKALALRIAREQDRDDQRKYSPQSLIPAAYSRTGADRLKELRAVARGERQPSPPKSPKKASRR